MLSSQEWQKLRVYTASDFKFPEKLQRSVVTGLDTLSGSTGKRAVILSDWRPFNSKRPGSEHPKGAAVDVVFPGTAPLDMLDKIKAARLFSGIGIYVNEKGQVSFHLDTRTNRTVDNPATWGAIIRQEIDPDTGAVSRPRSYTSMTHVLGLISSPTGWIVVLLAALAYLSFKRS